MKALVFSLAAALLCIAPTAACDSKSKDSAGTSEAEARYTVRGRLDQIANGKIYVFHEEIPDFVNNEGKATGMPAMQMPFAIGEDLDVSGFAIDDKLKMTFEVRFADAEPLRAVALEKLPADTELDLGE